MDAEQGPVQGTECDMLMDQRILRCQVEGCDANLAEDKQYSCKKRLCSQHMRAEVVVKRGEPELQWRFCFQCGKLELLDRFEGKQRSCKDRLVMRRKAKRPSTQQDVSTTTRSTKRGRTQSSAQNRSSIAAEEQPDLPDQQQQLELQVPLYMPAVYHEHQADWAAAGELSAEDFSSSDEGIDAAAVAATAVPTIHLQQQRRRQQQQLLEEELWVASVMAEQVQCAPLMRTKTAVSGTGLPAAEAEQQQLLSARMHPAGAAAHSLKAARAADELKSAAAMQSQLASLQQQCQQLAVQLHAQKSTFNAASAGAAAPQPNVLLSSSSASSTMLAPYALQATSVTLPEPQQHRQGVCSPGSPVSGATAVTAVQHHELVDMVVAHLDDMSASEEAQWLEALLEHELLAAAAAQPADAQRYSWALRLNQVIDSFSRSISSAATASAGTTSCSQHSYPAAAEHASAGMPAAQLLPAAGISHMLQGARHCAQTPAAAPTSMVGMKLATLQHQMVNLQGMIGMLKSQVGM